MTRFVALVAALLVADRVRAADTDLLFPNGDTARLRVEVAGEGKGEAVWAAFLGKLFAHFDRDGSGTLSEAEAKRMFALPLPGSREITPDFTVLDANRDGKVTLAEFRAFYRDRGFTPVTLVVQPAAADQLALGDALLRHLDRDGDGRLSAAELRQTASLLKRLDENEDEVLTATEILGAGRFTGEVAGLKPGSAAKEQPAVLKIAFGGKAELTSGGERFRLSADGSRLQVPGGSCAVAVVKDDPAAGFRVAKGFYLAQFKAAAGDKPATKATFTDDPTAQVLAGLFDAADRDGDGKLSSGELDAFFDLIELGVGCRVVVTVTDRGRNLFDLFDTNGDGRLDLDELNRAAKNLPNELARDKALDHTAVPASYRLVVSRGPMGDSFGPVPFGTAARPKQPATPAARGPKWFLAMDKNGDGFVSPQEFVGSPELFAKLDANGDGRISSAEAQAARE